VSPLFEGTLELPPTLDVPLRFDVPPLASFERPPSFDVPPLASFERPPSFVPPFADGAFDTLAVEPPVPFVSCAEGASFVVHPERMTDNVSATMALGDMK
jgi:hypothetical protein